MNFKYRQQLSCLYKSLFRTIIYDIEIQRVIIQIDGISFDLTRLNNCNKHVLHLCFGGHVGQRNLYVSLVF